MGPDVVAVDSEGQRSGLAPCRESDSQVVGCAQRADMHVGHCCLRATWAMKGQPAPVEISGANAKRIIYGILNIKTGNRLRWALQRHRAIDFQEFLEVVRWHHRGRHIAMVLDEESSHTAGTTRQFAPKLD